MRKYISIATIVVLLIVSLSGRSYAQSKTDTSISGHVTDSKNGEHLPYITIMLKGTQIGAQTSLSGHYVLRNLPVGKYELVATAIGYAEASFPLDLKAGESYEINFELQEENLSLDGVVVSATRNHSSRKEAPALVNVIDTRIFATTASPTLAEGLSFQPGVRVENDCQNCGFTQARINGLDGHYTQILIDSRPIFSALAGVYGLEQIPAGMIERVEVVRGGGSALFGASAIGGTINIITKEALRSGAELSNNLSFIGIGKSKDNNTGFNATSVSDDGRAGISIMGQKRSRDGYDADSDGFTDIPTLNSTTLGARGYLRISPYSKLNFEYHTVNEFRRGGDRLDRPAHEALIAEQTEHTNNSGSISYDGQSADGKHNWSSYLSAQHIKRNSYYGSGMDPNAYGRTLDLTAVAGAQYSYKFDRLFFLPAQLTMGLEHNYDRLYDVSLGYDHETEQTVNIFGAYLQNEWKTEHWSLLAGARMDKHSLISAPIFSPRVNLRFSPFRDLSFRAIYAGGFRAPQAFDEDLHVSVAGGERIRIRLADGLKEEKSHSFSLSGDWYHRIGRLNINLMGELFCTLLEDSYSLRQTGETMDGGMSSVMERYNGPGAKVYGTTLEGKMGISNDFSVQAGITLQRSLFDEPQQWSNDPEVEPSAEMFRSPGRYAYLLACYSPFKDFDIDLSGTYTGPMLVQHMEGSGTDVDVAVRTPSFWDLGVKFSYGFNILGSCRMNLSAGVKNMFNAYQKDFDKGELRDSAYIYGPSLPRTLHFGISLKY